MLNRLFRRAISLGLAAVLTLAMLGAIDQLADRHELPAQWAQQTAVRA